MKKTISGWLLTCLLLSITANAYSPCIKHQNEIDYISYIVNPATTTLRLFWKNDAGSPLKSLQSLKEYCSLKKEKLVFAMNGGMYKQDNSPLGLYVENGKSISPLNTKKGNGNFYLQPNGVLYITSNKIAGICSTKNFTSKTQVQYATQSGPMLLIDGLINTAFQKGSVNTNIRNGVGLLPGNKLLFAMSKKEVSLYAFADYFKQAGCSNALYLDGFISQTYLPAKKWIQTGGNFGVMIGAIEKQ